MSNIASPKPKKPILRSPRRRIAVCAIGELGIKSLLFTPTGSSHITLASAIKRRAFALSQDRISRKIIRIKRKCRLFDLLKKNSLISRKGLSMWFFSRILKTLAYYKKAKALSKKIENQAVKSPKIVSKALKKKKLKKKHCFFLF